MITFKSNEENFVKEKSGIKNNTFRKIDLNDQRFIDLVAIKTLRLPNRVAVIKIINADDISQSFDRWISDITFWDGYVIITWKQELVACSTKKGCRKIIRKDDKDYEYICGEDGLCSNCRLSTKEVIK